MAGVSSQHDFIADDEGLFCLFCGRTASEHRNTPGGVDARAGQGFEPGGRTDMFDNDVDGAELEEEDDWDAIQEELKRLTKRLRQESEAREKAELLLAEMKAAFEKLREDVGEIRTWGSNTDGQIGHRGHKPALVEIRGTLRQVSCGASHSAALTDDGQLYIWGRGNEGQLGLGDLRPRAVPALVKALGDKSAGTTVLQVACGGSHTIVLCDNGEVFTWGSNEEMQLGLGMTAGRKLQKPQLITDLVGKGVLRVAAGKNFSLALTEAGDLYSWGGGSSLQLGHGIKAGEEYPRLVDVLRDVRKIGTGANAEHAAALVGEKAAEEEGEGEEQEDEMAEAEEQLERARSRREDAMRAMQSDVETLELQVNKLDAKLDMAGGDEGSMARLHALREAIKSEVSELEVVVTGKQQLEESMALLNKHKTNQFRTNMLMKWSRPAAGSAATSANAAAEPAGIAIAGFTPRTLAKKQAELKQVGSERKSLLNDLKDVDDQLEQIELEKVRLSEASDEDPDIVEALEELREQLSESKKEKLAELQRREQAERALAAELGMSLGQEGADEAVAQEGRARGGVGAAGLDSTTIKFLKAAAGLWKKLEASSIEKVNVGQQEALGVKELVKLSNEQIDSIVAELHRVGGNRAKSTSIDEGEPLPFVYELLLDNSNCRKRLNDYTEGLLVQVAQKMDTFKAAYEASKAGKKEGRGSSSSLFTPRRL